MLVGSDRRLESEMEEARSIRLGCRIRGYSDESGAFAVFEDPPSIRLLNGTAATVAIFANGKTHGEIAGEINGLDPGFAGFVTSSIQELLSSGILTEDPV